MKTAPAAGSFLTPEDCEAAFYRAFRAGDLDAMAAIWEAAPDILCVHPGRAPLAGRGPVMDSWRDILGATGGVQVRFDCHGRAQSDGLAVHTGLELIGASGGDQAVVTVTNVYGLTGDGWKMRLHHAAPVHRNARRRGPVH
mgnify:CR=1 FL=1